MQYPDVLLDYVTKWCHQVIPMLACWWVLFLQNQFVSGEGNALLSLYISHQEILKCQLVAMAAYGVWICMYIGGMQFYFDMNLFFLSLRYRSHVADVSVGVGQPTVCILILLCLCNCPNLYKKKLI